ncbi:stalk domain-containing protein [Paenibacillus sp. MMO-58]|uniref:stalk domain-containing protein n=1 Tax=Paenibacillus sp. MMO-58 TaxID=3081290 RepID=UPI00301AE932
MKMGKKLVATGAVAALVVASFGAGAYAATQKITLIVNGTVAKADPITQNNTTYVPLRAAAEMLGASIGFDSKTNTVTVTSKGNITVDRYNVDDFVVTQLQAKNTEYLGWDVSAEVANINAKTVSSATLTAVFYDGSGKRIGSAVAPVSDLKSKDTKLINFLTTDDLTGYKTVKFQTNYVFYK